jgi:hypothetical protein
VRLPPAAQGPMWSCCCWRVAQVAKHVWLSACTACVRCTSVRSTSRCLPRLVRLLCPVATWQRQEPATAAPSQAQSLRGSWQGAAAEAWIMWGVELPQSVLHTFDAMAPSSHGSLLMLTSRKHHRLPCCRQSGHGLCCPVVAGRQPCSHARALLQRLVQQQTLKCTSSVTHCRACNQREQTRSTPGPRVGSACGCPAAHPDVEPACRAAGPPDRLLDHGVGLRQQALQELQGGAGWTRAERARVQV